MKILLWSVFAVLALLWTGGAALLAQVIEWSAQGLAAGGAASAGAAVSSITLPSWLGVWIDVATWSAVQQVVAGLLQGASGVLPVVGEVASWLVPLVWVTWGVGLLMLLGLAVAGAWALGRYHDSSRRDLRAA